MVIKSKTHSITLAAVLIAIGTIIPLVSPLKIVMEPASFTLASHVAIFIAMFISPFTAISVAIGTTIGFLLGGFPIVIVFRAGTHIVFALVGSFILKRHPQIMHSVVSMAIFAFAIAIIHAVCEVGAVTAFYFGNQMSSAYYAKGFVNSVVMLIGVGSVIHSLVDFAIAAVVWKALTFSVKPA